MKEPKTFSELIDLWGLRDFYKDMEISRQSAWAMRDRNNINQRHWAKLLVKAKTRNRVKVTMQTLIKMSENR